ncbi:hypothetical protein K1719_001407 [Acacia pycnantha]|nr:hypothetical protein K1719_001407 [Acacia pycnantha]
MRLLVSSPSQAFSQALGKLGACCNISMSWPCKRCTFLNPPSQKSTCQICLSSPPSLSPPPSSSSSSSPKWPCKSCTFLNPYKNSNCEICDARCHVLSLSNFEDLNDPLYEGDLDPSVGSVFFPLRSCKRKITDSIHIDGDRAQSGSFRDVKASRKEIQISAAEDLGKSLSSLKILSYNVWFREDLEVHKRMKAIGDLIQHHNPDLIFFQEVTPNIFDILKESSWWNVYRCSVSLNKAYSRQYFCMVLSKLPVKAFSTVPFSNSIMGRELCIAEIEVMNGKPFVVATSHLESPCPAPPKWDQMYSKERVEQAREAMNVLCKYPNVVFGGDMNWDDKTDGQFPLKDGWIDAWSQLRPDENGWTYDTKSNQMLAGNRTLQKRLDRFICSLQDFKIRSIDMVGMNEIPGVSYTKEKKAKKETKQLVLPVLPSDHFGLVLTVSTK